MNRNIYLSKCDLINKTNISNVNDCSYITKVVIEFFFSNLNNSDVSSQLKSFLSLYIVNGINPKIIYNSVSNETLISANRSKIFDYLNKVCLESKGDINTFINFLFIENDFKTHANNYQLKKLTNSNASVSYCINIPLSSFKEVTDLFNSDIKDIFIEDICVRISFVIKINSEMEDKFVKNLFPFWYFG